jgi:hypothetical protein
LIEQFTNKYAACPTIITSRFVGYWDAPLSDDFSVYHLAAFNDDEVAAFAYKFIKVIELLKRPEAHSKARRFLDQTTHVGKDLRENPLMLGLMVYLFVYRGDVPSNRPEIYKECATLMFEKWDQRRDIIFKIPTDFDLLDLFSFLASKIFGSPETEDGVSREWLISELRLFFENWYLEKAKALQAARSLVEFITGRAWVMYDVGPNVFKFTHRTFLEYFFARHLISTSDSINTLIRFHLFPKVSNSQWEVIGHLALQTAVFRDAGKMLQAADAVVSILKDEFRDSKARLTFLIFVSKSLEYLLLPERRYYEIIKLIVESAVALGANYDPAAVSVFNTLIGATRKRETIAQSAVYEALREKLKLATSAEQLFAMFSISTFNETPYLLRFVEAPAPAWELAKLNNRYFEKLRREFQHINFSRALNNIADGRMYLFVYEDGFKELFDRFGLDVLYSTQTYSILRELPDVIQLGILSVASTGRRRAGNSDQSSPASRAFINSIADMILREKHVTVPGSYISAESRLLTDAAVHTLYDLSKAKHADAEFLAKALIALAVSLDIGRVTGRRSEKDPEMPWRRRGGGNERLLSFMPPEPMVEMLRTAANHSLSALISDWNNEKVQFAQRAAPA